MSKYPNRFIAEPRLFNTNGLRVQLDSRRIWIAHSMNGAVFKVRRVLARFYYVVIEGQGGGQLEMPV